MDRDKEQRVRDLLQELEVVQYKLIVELEKDAELIWRLGSIMGELHRLVGWQSAVPKHVHGEEGGPQ